VKKLTVEVTRHYTSCEIDGRGQAPDLTNWVKLIVEVNPRSYAARGNDSRGPTHDTIQRAKLTVEVKPPSLYSM